MGLDIDSADDVRVTIFHGAYSAFYRFREAVSELICSGGVNKTKANEDAYEAFMAHSDCDGEWTWEQCRDLEAMLRPKLTEVKKDHDLGGHIGKFKDTLTVFLDGLKHCADSKVAASFH
jgi:hypothetical protein